MSDGRRGVAAAGLLMSRSVLWSANNLMAYETCPFWAEMLQRCNHYAARSTLCTPLALASSFGGWSEVEMQASLRSRTCLKGLPA